MRVIQPNSYNRNRTNRHNRQLRFIFAIFLTCLATSGVYFYKTSNNYQIPASKIKEPVASSQVKKELRIFTDEEIKDLYNNFHYTNTYKIIEPPPITGDEATDTKIRTLAEARGYRLRRLARNAEPTVDGFPLQALAEKSLVDMKAEAAKEGMVLTVTSALRTIDDQRDLFMEGLAGEGVEAQNIVSGQADALVDKVLQTYAPPGYSRHHTGYTIDLTCGTNGLTNFATTVCYDWLARDNYKNAKTFGWAPSYPEAASFQGPEPEPWEYVWVTTDALLK